MKKEAFALFLIFLLFISGCGITGKGVASSDSNADKRILECAKLCNDGSQSEEEFINSCSKILQYGGEETFNDYVDSCR